jgi:hypothetical protein
MPRHAGTAQCVRVGGHNALPAGRPAPPPPALQPPPPHAHGAQVIAPPTHTHPSPRDRASSPSSSLFAPLPLPTTRHAGLERAPVTQTNRMSGSTYLVGVLPQGHGEGAGQTKVCQFQHPMHIHQDVLGLQVPVHNAPGVARIQPAQQLVQVGLGTKAWCGTNSGWAWGEWSRRGGGHGQGAGWVL